MIVVNTETIPGHQVVEALGVVRRKHHPRQAHR